MAGSRELGGRPRGEDGGAPLDETLEAPGRSQGRPSRVPAGGGRPLESGERDYPELAPVDPDHYIQGHEVARGGMGRIVAARDRRLGRLVAIKELLQESPERAARFEREALITARLQHPSIANLHEAGRWPSGKPFYAMKLVAGRSLAEVAGEARPLAERLALLPNLIAVVEAVAYAHKQRIIHRDLKPSNVLIGDLGETVVIDWGLAKDLAAEPGDRTHLPGGTDDTLDARAARPADGGSVPRSASVSLTVIGSIMGTPGYMPPEQATGAEVDERADVYALGAILYHLLGGSGPYPGRTPESILAAVLAGPPRPLARVEPRLAQDLVTIIEKAMARAEDARYPTAVELAEDLRRFQTGRLVAAHRYSRRELVWRFVARHRAAVVAALVAVAAIAAVALVSFRRVIAERDRAEAAGLAAARRADELAVAQAAALLDDDPRASLELHARLSPDASPPIWRRARLVASDARLRGIPTILHGHENPIASLAVSPDGTMLVSADTHEVRAWNLRTGESRALGRQDAIILRTKISPDARFAATAGFDNRIRLWSLEGGMVGELGGHEGMLIDLAFVPGGAQLVSAGADGAVRLWQTSGRGHELLGEQQGKVFKIDVSDDGSSVAAVGEDGAVRVWRLRPREPVRELRPAAGNLNVVALSADGSLVAAAGPQKDMWLIDVASGAARRLDGHDEEVRTMDFSADGRRLATAGADRTIRVWDVETGKSQVLRDHADEIDAVTFAGGNDLLFSSGRDGAARVWALSETSAAVVQVLGGHSRYMSMDVSYGGGTVVSSHGSRLRRWEVTARGGVLRGHRGLVSQVEFTRAGVLSAANDWTVRLWPASGGAARTMRGHQATITFLSASGDGRRAASIDEVRIAWLWDLGSGAGRELSGRAYGEPCFSPDGRLLFAPSENHTVRVWSTATGEARVLRGHTGWVTAVAVSPDGRHLASAGADRVVRLWDLRSGAGRALEGHETPVRYVAFAGDGLVVSSEMGGVVREWDVASGKGRLLGRAASGIHALAATKTGNLLAWADGEGRVHLWSRTGEQVRVLVNPGKNVDQLLFSPDERTLVGRDSDGRHVLLWDTSVDALLVLPTHGRDIADVAISPDGLAIATADSDRTVRLWPYDLPYDAGSLRAWLARNAAPVEAR